MKHTGFLVFGPSSLVLCSRRQGTQHTAYGFSLPRYGMPHAGFGEVLFVAKMGRRYKVYAAETGISYQYFFESRRRVFRPEGQGPGSDFTFVVVADQHPPFTLKVFVSDRAVEAWRQSRGGNLDANELYAAAKMRLFRAFDEEEHLRQEALNLLVDQTNVEELLEPLGLGD